MAINLTKGQRIDVGLRKAAIGLGWNPNTQASAHGYDLDASAFMLGENGKLVSGDHFVYYNNLESPDKALTSTGDNRTGEGDGDDETLIADIDKIDARVSEIVFVVTIHEAEIRKQNFGQVRNAFIRIYDTANGEEICKYELDEDFSTESAVEFGRLYRRDGAWKFEAIGRGHKGGLENLVTKFS
ncbi:MAG: TerD family protein [Pedosphaera sp.]|nr:TerD family protein [Pedosphaera sp.]